LAQHAGREHIGLRRQDVRQLGARETQTLPHRNAPLQQEGAVPRISTPLGDMRAVTLDGRMDRPAPRLRCNKKRHPVRGHFVLQARAKTFYHSSSGGVRERDSRSSSLSPTHEG